MAGIFKYDHTVKVSAEPSEFLGPGQFVGESGINRLTGMPMWRGVLHANIDPRVLVDSGQLSLEFDNGVVGHARCASADIDATSQRGFLFRVKLTGVREPPRVELLIGQ